MYSGRQPASTALIATFSATTTVFRPRIAVDLLVRIGLARVARGARHLDRDVWIFGERERVLEIGKRRVVSLPGTAAVAPEMIDVELEPRMPLGDLRQRRHVPAGQEPDRQPLPLARLPEPVA